VERRYPTGLRRSVIDECSTVSNADLLKVLENTSFKLVVLVGDVYQIESIQFGNWFSIVRSFVPADSVFELTKPFRTDNEALLDSGPKSATSRTVSTRRLRKGGYSAVLDESCSRPLETKIILCLNYDGLYGINNVNRFLQSCNPGKAVCGMQRPTRSVTRCCLLSRPLQASHFQQSQRPDCRRRGAS